MIQQKLILNKINTLPPSKIAEVIDFIDFLAEREALNKRTERFSMIAEYAIENADTEFDFDADLEKSSVENLLAINEEI